MVSFGDAPISMLLSAPGFVTFPVGLFYGMENDFNPAVLASSTLVIVLSFVVMFAVQRFVRLESLIRTQGSGG